MRQEKVFGALPGTSTARLVEWRSSTRPDSHREWIEACKGGKPATCNFDYTGPLAETVLLGNVAYRAGGGFDWDAAKLHAQGNDKAAALIHPSFREGWEI